MIFVDPGHYCSLLIKPLGSWSQSNPPFPFSLSLSLFLSRVGEDGPWDQSQYINTQSNLTTHQVTGLLPFNVYSFRLIAVNELGPSPPSKESYYIVTLREGEYIHSRKLRKFSNLDKSSFDHASALGTEENQYTAPDPLLMQSEP